MKHFFCTGLASLVLIPPLVFAQVVDHAVIPGAVCLTFEKAVPKNLLVDGKPGVILARGEAQAIVKLNQAATLSFGSSTLLVEPFSSSATTTVRLEVTPVAGPGGQASAMVRSGSPQPTVVAVYPPGQLGEGGVWLRTTTPTTVPLTGPPGEPFQMVIIDQGGAALTAEVDTSLPSQAGAEPTMVADDRQSRTWLWVGGGVLVAGGVAAASSSSGGGNSSPDSSASSSTSGTGSGGSGSSTCSDSDLVGTWRVPGAQAEFGYDIGVTFSSGGSAFVFADVDGGGGWSLAGCTLSLSSGVAPFVSCSGTVSPGGSSVTLCGKTLKKD